MRVGKCHTSTGRTSKPIFDEGGFVTYSGGLKDGERIDCTMSNGTHQVTITRAEYDQLDKWFRKGN